MSDSRTYFYHHGIKGQRWGIRRYQNEDGSLTGAGKKRYDINADGSAQLKDKFRTKQNLIGGAKAIIGTTIATRTIQNIAKDRSNKVDFTSKSGKRKVNRAIFGVAIGSIIVGSGVKNFINANKNKQINSIGKGGTPEVFQGKPQTRNQVLNKNKKK